MTTRTVRGPVLLQDSSSLYNVGGAQIEKKKKSSL